MDKGKIKMTKKKQKTFQMKTAFIVIHFVKDECK